MKMRLATGAACALLGLGLITFVACDAVNPSAEGRVRVLLTDAPLEELAAVNVVIERVELVGGEDSDAPRVVLTDEPQAFDLLTLQNGVTADLADVTVPEGRYSQLRLIVAEEAHVAFADGTTETLKIPSGTETGVKILLPSFDIQDNDDEVVITVDFDAARSIVKTGAGDKYIFKPVIKPLSLNVNSAEVEVENEEEEEEGEEQV